MDLPITTARRCLLLLATVCFTLTAFVSMAQTTCNPSVVKALTLDAICEGSVIKTNGAGGFFEIVDPSYKPLTTSVAGGVSYAYNGSNSIDIPATVSQSYSTVFMNGSGIGTCFISNRVDVVQPPTLKIVNTSFSDCSPLVINSVADIGVSGSYKTIVWEANDGQKNFPFTFTSNIPSTKILTATATNPPCADITPIAITCNIKTPPVFNPYPIAPSLPEIVACSACVIDYPSESIFSASPGTITSSSITWDKYNPVLNTSNSPGVRGIYSATLDSTNSCGTRTITVDTTIYQRVKVDLCEPTLSSSVTTLGACETLDIFIRTGTENEKLIANKTTVTPSPLIPCPLVSSTNSELKYEAKPTGKTNFLFNIAYSQKCPNKSLPVQEVLIKKSLSINVDTSVVSTYNYCPYDTAYLSITGTKFKEIKSVEILPPADNLFVNVESSKLLYRYVSKKEIDDPIPYTSIKLKITYYLTTCDQDLVFDKNVLLETKTDCKPEFSVIYHDGGSACAGDTIKINTSENSLPYEILSIEMPSSNYYRGDPIPTIEKTGVKSSYSYNFYSYHCYTNVPVNTVSDKDMSFKLSYNYRGNRKDTVMVRKISVKSCPPIFGKQLPLGYCPNSVRGLAGCTFDVYTQNRTTSPSKVFNCTWYSTPYRKVDSILQRSDRGTKLWMTRYLSHPINSTNYEVSVDFNEGDSIRNTKLQATYTFAGACFPPVIPSRDSVCAGDSITFTITLDIITDTLTKKIDWSGSPSNVEFLKKVGLTYYFITRNASNEGKYVCNLNLFINDTIAVYPLYPKIKVRSVSDLSIFIKDTVNACVNTMIHLNEYLNTGVKNVIYGSDSVFKLTATINAHAMATAALRCDFMDALGRYSDSILIIKDESAYMNIDPSLANQEVCLGDSVDLSISSNAYITWVKHWNSPLQSDTIFKDIAGNKILKEKLTTDARYEAIAKNSCAAIVTTNISATALPLPIFTLDSLRQACPYDLITIGTTCNNCDPINSKYELFDLRSGSSKIIAAGYTISLSEQDSLLLCYSGVSTNGGCKKSDSTIIYPYKKPVLGINGGQDKDTLCLVNGSGFTLTASGADSYKWLTYPSTIGSSMVLNTKKDSVIFVQGTENIHSCRDTISVFCAVSIYPPNTVLKDSSLCANGDICFNVENLPSATYNWQHSPTHSSSNPALSSTAELCLKNVQSSDTGIYSVSLSRLGCVEYATAHLALFSTPNPSLKTSNLICEGDDIKIDLVTGLSLTEEATARISWVDPKNNTTLNGKTFTIKNASLSDSGIYKVIVTTKHCGDSAEEKITVKERIISSFKLDPFYCENSTDTLYINPFDDANNYRWMSTSGRNDAATDSSYIITFNKSDSTFLMLEIFNGACLDTMKQFVNVVPSPVFTFLSSDTGICVGESIVLKTVLEPLNSACLWFLNSNGNNTQIGNGLSFSINNAVSADSGNYYVVASLNSCKSTSNSINLSINPLPDVMVDSGLVLCKGSTVTLSAYSHTDGSFAWRTVDAAAVASDVASAPVAKSKVDTSSIIVTKPGLYIVERTSIFGCKAYDSANVEERNLPVFTLRSDTSVCKGETVLIEGPENKEEYLWNTGSDLKDIIVETKGLYILSTTDSGCSFSDSVSIKFVFCGGIYFASAFTPNSNNMNESWGAITSALPEELEFELYVFNRNGKILFHTTQSDKQWDGKYKGEDCMPGVYTFQCKVKDKSSGTDLSRSGTVTIVK